jgi:hypothetical protein
MGKLFVASALLLVVVVVLAPVFVSGCSIFLFMLLFNETKNYSIRSLSLFVGWYQQFGRAKYSRIKSKPNDTRESDINRGK